MVYFIKVLMLLATYFIGIVNVSLPEYGSLLNVFEENCPLYIDTLLVGKNCDITQNFVIFIQLAN